MARIYKVISKELYDKYIAKPPTEEPLDDIEWVLSRLQEQQRPSARGILTTLLDGHLTFDRKTGEISTQGNTVEGSNIVDLVSLATSPTRIKNHNLPGIYQFLQALCSLQVFRNLLSKQTNELLDVNFPRFAWITYESRF